MNNKLVYWDEDGICKVGKLIDKQGDKWKIQSITNGKEYLVDKWKTLM